MVFPFGDLGGMDSELLGQFRQRLVAFDRRQRHLRLKRRPVIPTRPLHRLAPFGCHPCLGG